MPHSLAVQSKSHDLCQSLVAHIERLVADFTSSTSPSARASRSSGQSTSLDHHMAVAAMLAGRGGCCGAGASGSGLTSSERQKVALAACDAANAPVSAEELSAFEKEWGIAPGGTVAMTPKALSRLTQPGSAAVGNPTVEERAGECAKENGADASSPAVLPGPGNSAGDAAEGPAHEAGRRVRPVEEVQADIDASWAELDALLAQA